MTTRKLYAVRTPLCLAFGLCLGLATSEAGAAPTVFEDIFVMRMTSGSGHIVWSTFEDCDRSEFPPICRVRRRAASTPMVGFSSVFNNALGALADNLAGNGEIAADESYVYWQSLDGEIMRDALLSAADPDVVALKQSAA